VNFLRTGKKLYCYTWK